MSKRNKKKELPNRKITAWSTVEKKKDVYDLTGDDEGSTDDHKQTSSRSHRGGIRAAMKSKEDLIDERLKAAGISDHGQMSLEEKKELLEVLGVSLTENSVLKSHDPSYLCKPEGRPSIHGSPSKSTIGQTTTSKEASAAVLESDGEITVEDPKPTKGRGRSHRKPTSKRQSLLSWDKPVWKDDRIHSVDTTKRRNRASQQRREQELNDSQRSNSSLGGFKLSGEPVTSEQDIDDLDPGSKVKDDDDEKDDPGLKVKDDDDDDKDESAASDEGEQESEDGCIDVSEKESHVMDTEDGDDVDNKPAGASPDASLDPLVLTETSTDNLTDEENGPRDAATSNVRVTTMNDLINHADTNTDKSDRVTVTITSMDEESHESVIYKKDFPGETRLSITETDEATNITCDNTQSENQDAGSQELFQSQPTPWQEKVSEAEEDMDIYDEDTQPLSPSGDSRGHHSRYHQSQEERQNLKRKASTCSEEEPFTKRPHLTEADFMSHDPEPPVCLVNKRRISCKYIDKQPFYAPAGKSFRSYAKVIQNYFTQYGVLLRKAQSKQIKRIPPGKPIEVGRHWSKTIDAKKRGQHSMYMEMSSGDSDLEILDNTTRARTKDNPNSRKLQLKKSATLPVTKSKDTDSEIDEDFQEMPSFQPKLRKLRSQKSDRCYHSQSQTSDISRDLSPSSCRNEVLLESPPGGSRRIESPGPQPGGSRNIKSPESPPGGSRNMESPGSPPGASRNIKSPGSPPGGSRNKPPGSPPGGSRNIESPASPPGGSRNIESPGSPPGGSKNYESPVSLPGSPESLLRSGNKIKDTMYNTSQSCSETENYESDKIKQNVGETGAVVPESAEEELRDHQQRAHHAAPSSGSPLRKRILTADGQDTNTDGQQIQDGCTSESQDDGMPTDLKVNLSSQETDDTVEFSSVGSPVFGRWMKSNQPSPRNTTPAKRKILGRKGAEENESVADEDLPEDNSTADEFEDYPKSHRRRLLRSETSNIFKNIGDFGDSVHTLQDNQHAKGQTGVIGRGQRGRGQGTLKKGQRSGIRVKDAELDKREVYMEDSDLDRRRGPPQNTATTPVPVETRHETSEGTLSEEELVIENDNSSQSAPPHVRPLNVSLEKLDSMLQSQDSQSSQGLSASDTGCELPESPLISRNSSKKTSLSKKLSSESSTASSSTPRSSLTRRKLRDTGHGETPQAEFNTNTNQCVDEPAEGASSHETVQCPLCGEYFSRDNIETHAANCPEQISSQQSKFSETRVTRQVAKSKHGPAITISSPTKKPAKNLEKVNTQEDQDNSITVNDDTDQLTTADTSNEDTLGDCPLCGKQFSIAALVEHANQCLDISVSDQQGPVAEGQQSPPALRDRHHRKTGHGSRDDGAGDSDVRSHRQSRRTRDQDMAQKLIPKKSTLQTERKTESPGPSKQRFSRKPLNRSGLEPVIEDHERQVDGASSTRHSGLQNPATSSEVSSFDRARAIQKKQTPRPTNTGASTVAGSSRSALRRRGRVQEEIQLISDSDSDLPEERQTLRIKKRKR